MPRGHSCFFSGSWEYREDIPYERLTSPTLIIHAVGDPAPPIAGARLMIPGLTTTPRPADVMPMPSDLLDPTSVSKSFVVKIPAK